MKDVRNSPRTDNNAPAKDTTRHPKRSHRALVIGPKKKFKPMAIAPIHAVRKKIVIKKIVSQKRLKCY